MDKVSIIHISEPEKTDDLDREFISELRKWSDKIIFVITGEISPQTRESLSGEDTFIMVMPGVSGYTAWSEGYRVHYDLLKGSDMIIFASTEAYYYDFSVEACVEALNKEGGDIFTAECTDPPFVMISEKVIKDYSFERLFNCSEKSEHINNCRNDLFYEEDKSEKEYEGIDDGGCSCGSEKVYGAVSVSADTDRSTDVAAYFEGCGFRAVRDDDILKIISKTLLQNITPEKLDEAIDEIKKTPRDHLAEIKRMVYAHNPLETAGIVCADCFYMDEISESVKGIDDTHILYVVYDRRHLNDYGELLGELITAGKLTFIVPYEILPDLKRIIPEADVHPAYPSEIDPALYELKDRVDEKYFIILSDNNIDRFDSGKELYRALEKTTGMLKENSEYGMVILQIYEKMSDYAERFSTYEYRPYGYIDLKDIIAADMSLYKDICEGEAPVYCKLPEIFASRGRASAFLRQGVSLKQQLFYIENMLEETKLEELNRVDPSDELTELLHEAEENLEKALKENRELKEKIKKLTDQNKKLKEKQGETVIKEVPIAVDMGVKGAIKNWVNKKKQ